MLKIKSGVSLCKMYIFQPFDLSYLPYSYFKLLNLSNNIIGEIKERLKVVKRLPYLDPYILIPGIVYNSLRNDKLILVWAGVAVMTAMYVSQTKHTYTEPH